MHVSLEHVQCVGDYPKWVPEKRKFEIVDYFHRWIFTVIFFVSSMILESGRLSQRPSVAIRIKSFSSTLNDVTDAKSGLKIFDC